MTPRDEPMVRRIDHVIVESADEGALFEFLTDTLDLPIAWPVAQWGRFHEGGASVGNCNLGCNHLRDPSSDPIPTVRRIALEPTIPIAEVVEALDQQHRLLTPPIVSGEIALPDTEQYAPWRRGWTVLQLRTDLDPSPFICTYDHDVGARVRTQESELEAGSGGRLGVTGLREVIIHVDDVGHTISEWRSLLLLPERMAAGVVAFTAGPRLQFRLGSAPPALVLGVRSITAAIGALVALSIRHHLRDELRLDPSDALGLDLRLVEDVRPSPASTR